MTTNRSWYFEETCPSCDATNTYHFSEVDEYGFIICKTCGCKTHACSLCDNHDNCNDCDEHDTDKSRWRSDDMTEYMHYRLKLSAEKQVVFSQYLNMQSGIIKALYDDDVDPEAFKSIISNQLSLDSLEPAKKPEFEEDRLYIDKAGSAWFRHRGHDFQILKLARFCPETFLTEGKADIGKLTVACENDVYRTQLNAQGKLSSALMEGFYLVPDCWCDYFDVTDDDEAWLKVSKELLPAIDRWIDSNNKEIH